MNYDTIEVHLSSEVACIFMNRPEAMNALNTQMRAEITDAYKRLAPQARVISFEPLPVPANVYRKVFYEDEYDGGGYRLVDGMFSHPRITKLCEGKQKVLELCSGPGLVLDDFFVSS